MSPETMSSWQGSWQVWALLSAMFAALTAIFAKVGVEDINPDLATFIRTVIVLASFALILFATGQFSRPGTDLRQNMAVPGVVRTSHRRIVALLLPRSQAWTCDACRTDRQIERRAGGPVCIRLFGRTPFRHRMARHRADRGRRRHSRNQEIISLPLVWWFRSSLHFFSASFKRTSEPEPPRIIGLLVSP